MSQPNEFYAPGLICLRIKKDNNNNNNNNNNQINENRFLYQIKKYGLTDTEIFYFDFNEKEGEYDGYFVIGEELFNNDNFLRIYIFFRIRTRMVF